MDRRKELKQEAREAKTDAGVYQIKNNRSGKVLIVSTRNLKTMNGQRFTLEMGSHTNKALQRVPRDAPDRVRGRRTGCTLYEETLAGKTHAGVQVLYISPLKALNNDIHRNLAVPLEGIAGATDRRDGGGSAVGCCRPAGCRPSCLLLPGPGPRHPGEGPRNIGGPLRFG